MSKMSELIPMLQEEESKHKDSLCHRNPIEWIRILTTIRNVAEKDLLKVVIALGLDEVACAECPFKEEEQASKDTCERCMYFIAASDSSNNGVCRFIGQPVKYTVTTHTCAGWKEKTIATDSGRLTFQDLIDYFNRLSEAYMDSSLVVVPEVTSAAKCHCAFCIYYRRKTSRPDFGLCDITKLIVQSTLTCGKFNATMGTGKEMSDAKKTPAA